MKIAVIDGQGGGIGRVLVEKFARPLAIRLKYGLSVPIRLRRR